MCCRQLTQINEMCATPSKVHLACPVRNGSRHRVVGQSGNPQREDGDNWTMEPHQPSKAARPPKPKAQRELF
jgi:hypothetical protein